MMLFKDDAPVWLERIAAALGYVLAIVVAVSALCAAAVGGYLVGVDACWGGPL